MFEVYVLVAKKKSVATILLASLFLALGIVFLLLVCTGNLMMLTLSVVAFGLFYFFQFRTNKEFEYSYFDGECRFAKVMNKSRCMSLQVFTMDDVIQIAPAGDRSVYKYEKDSAIKTYNYTSGLKGTPYYVLVRKKGEAIEMIRFEPDDKYLDAVCTKYSAKVVRRQEA